MCNALKNIEVPHPFHNRKRYVTENAYYKTQEGMWVFAQVLYDMELDMYVNPDGSICTRVRETIPYGEITMNGISTQDDKLEPMRLPSNLIDLINNEYEFYQKELDIYLDE